MNDENDIDHDDIYLKLHDRSVKDLYWLLFSKCPINNRHPELSEVPFFPFEILNEWRTIGCDYFLNLDRYPNDLHEFLKRPKNSRLGFYAEGLLSFFFQTFSGIELLIQNHQIIHKKKTLGEVDFIIRWKERVLHIECAIKFYLFDHSKSINDLHSWVGPACKDDLGRKIKKVREHQLPMINSSKCIDILGLNNIESYLFLKGKLFVNQEVSCDWLSTNLLGRYYFIKNIREHSGLKVLIKPFWMSNQSETNIGTNEKNFDTKYLLKRAELVQEKGAKPFFIAPNDWPFLNS